LLFKNVPTYLQNLSRSGESASAPDDPLFNILVEKKEPDEEDETVEKRYAYGSGA
jgi:hypothetical protein